MDRVPIIKNPELFDRVIANIQKGLADGLPWLNYSFGRADRANGIIPPIFTLAAMNIC